VLDPGSVPGRKLAWSISPDAEVHLTARVSVGVVVSAGDRQPPLEGPGEVVFPLTVKGGTVTVGRPGPTRDVVAGELKALCPITAKFRFDERGRVMDLDFPIPSYAPKRSRLILAALRDRIQWLVPPLPEEEIGVGAEWKVVRPTGTDVTIFRYRLTELTGTTGRVAVEMESRIRERADLKKMSEETTGEGMLLFDLSRPVATGEIAIAGQVEYNVEGQDRHQVVRIDTKVRTALEPAN
jgi:hypothetical protein